MKHNYNTIKESLETNETSKDIKVIGIVSDCKKLRIRKDANDKADEVCIIDVGSEVTIDPNKSTYDWLNVTTELGFTGFCMKRFVTVL